MIPAGTGSAERLEPASDATRERLRRLTEAPLSLAEWQTRLAVPVTDEEHEDTIELVRWFMRRYPTPAERLAYVRRAYRRWTATHRR